MIVRALDSEGDWLFGKGKQDYLTNQDAIAQSIKTRLSMFLGDCFFATNQGIDWFNLLGSKNQLQLNLAISAVILNTENVTGILQLSSELTPSRKFTVRYSVQTTFSVLGNIFQYDFGIAG